MSYEYYPRKKGHYTDEEMALLADLRMPSRFVASELGIHKNTVNKIRRDISAGKYPREAFSDEEIDFILDMRGRATTSQIADYLGKKSREVRDEILRLRKAGITLVKIAHPLRPWQVGTRPLLAKTCTRCGLLLGREWFYFKESGESRGWSSACKFCLGKSGSDRRDDYHGKYKEDKKRAKKFQYKLQNYSIPRATSNGNEWTQADMKVLQDESITPFQKALTLRRTYFATVGALSKFGFISKPELGDPQDGQWRIVFEESA